MLFTSRSCTTQTTKCFVAEFHHRLCWGGGVQTCSRLLDTCSTGSLRCSQQQLYTHENATLFLLGLLFFVFPYCYCLLGGVRNVRLLYTCSTHDLCCLPEHMLRRVCWASDHIVVAIVQSVWYMNHFLACIVCFVSAWPDGTCVGHCVFWHKPSIVDGSDSSTNLLVLQ